MKEVNKMSNLELLSEYQKAPRRGSVASEMCKRAGTIRYLLSHCVDSDKKFYSCMRDTVDVLNKKIEVAW